MNLDEVKKPTIKSSEPYCSGKKGAVVGRCNALGHNCNNQNYKSCLCNQKAGNIEKCSKYISCGYRTDKDCCKLIYNFENLVQF